MGPVPPRQDQPELLYSGPELHRSPSTTPPPARSRDLTIEDLDRPDVAEFSKSVESAVVHYGDITMTFLNNWFRPTPVGRRSRTPRRSPSKRSRVIDYNLGNPDGELSRRRTATHAPRTAGRDLPEAKARCSRDNPFIIFERTVGERRAEARPQRFPGLCADAREPDQGPAVRLPSRQPRPWPSVHRSRPKTVSTRPALSGARRPDTRSAREGARHVGRAAQERTGHARCRRVWFHGRAAGGGWNETKLDLAKRAAIVPSPSSKTTTRLACASSPLGSRPTPK